MKHFEASGLWYPSDDPTNAVGGTLKFDGEGLHLALLGSFRKGWSPEAELYPIIHGVVGECPYGAFVTLLDCFKIQSKFNMIGVTSEKIRCQRAAIGNFHMPERPSRFEKLDLDFSYLTEWVGLGGMSVEQKLADANTYVASYLKPENVHFSFGDKTLTLDYEFNASQSTHETTLTEAAVLVVEPVGDLTPATLGEDHVRMLQDLFTFATDRPNEVEEIAYRAEKDERGLTPKLNLIYNAIFQLEKKERNLHSFDMMFNYADTKAAGLDIFQRWFDFSHKHQEFCLVYFGHIYAEPKYLDEKFAKVLSAFTLLCTALGETFESTKLFLADAEAALKAHFPDDERVFLGHILPSGPEVEMPLHLLRLLRENAEIMGQVIEDFPSFIRSVSDTLAFIERRVEGGRPSLEGGDLLYARKKILMLIKIVILKELGFDEDAVKALVGRNKGFNYLKMV